MTEYRRSVHDGVAVGETVVASLTPGSDGELALRWATLQRTWRRATALRAEAMCRAALEEGAARYSEFFVAASTLLDVIEADSGVAASVKQQVRPAFRSEPALCVVRDLSNTWKHLRLTAPTWSGTAPAVEEVRGEAAGNRWRVAVAARHGKRRIDAAELASQVMAAWERIFDALGIRVETPAEP